MNSSNILKHNFPARLALIILIIICSFLFLGTLIKSQTLKAQTPPSPPPQETRAAVVVSFAPTPTPTPSPSATPQSSHKPTPNKDSYIVAAFGDSMVDTMGENLDYLDKEMTALYPSTKFKFYNYGIGSQNVLEANARFSNSFNYKTRSYPSISEIKPDIIIISSFAYNPLYPYDNAAYTNALKEIISKSKSTGAKVYLLTEIAPLQEGFGKGVGGVNWDDTKTKEHVGYILENLNSAVSLASQTSTPLINAFKASQVDGKYGNKQYVSSHDGIHPSIQGEIFMADLIANTIKLP